MTEIKLIVDILLKSGVIIIATDTLYGILALAHSRSAVDKVYKIKQRSPKKPPIVLISDLSQIIDKPSPKQLVILKSYWPGPNSIILPSSNAPHWLSRGQDGIAYRLINKGLLADLIRQTGPLIAPSANPEGKPPAKDISQAKQYFGDQVDLYIDSGEITSTSPSQLYLWTKSEMKRLR